MSIFSFFRSPKKTSAEQAKERLQIVMAHSRVGRTGPDFLPMLQQELLAVIAKYIDLDQNKVEVKLDKGEDCSTLEVNIELPVPGEVVAKIADKLLPKSFGKPPAPAVVEVRKDAKPGDAKADGKVDGKLDGKAGLKTESKPDAAKADGKADVAKDDSKLEAKAGSKMGAAGRG